MYEIIGNIICTDRNIKTIISLPINAKKSKKKNASSERNQTIAYIKEKGIYAWKTKNNYGRRNRVENTFYRLKTIFGRQFSSRTWDNQEAESKLICNLLNTMTGLGMPVTEKAPNLGVRGKFALFFDLRHIANLKITVFQM